jgi:predicted metal-dependent HD superfamily phosphohydrolase
VFECRHAPLTLPPTTAAVLAAAYAEPQRAYHTAQHIAEVLRWFDAVADDVGWHDPAGVYHAIVFHDAIYDPTRGDNEARSAELARAHGASDRACELILLTAQHGKLATAPDADAAHFLDADTAILGAEPAAFAAYDAAIAIEYRHLPPEVYAAGRAAFLAKLLARPRIYYSDYFFDRLEAAARRNLTARA